MKVADKYYQTIYAHSHIGVVEFIDQTKLPYEFELVSTDDYLVLITAIRTMQVRGAPVIGICGALALVLGTQCDSSNSNIEHLAKQIISSRPTAVNLYWAVTKIKNFLLNTPEHQRKKNAWNFAEDLIQSDICTNKLIGEIGSEIIHKSLDKPFNILTHCNAGWLATVDYGTALSPIFHAFEQKKNIHIWVDETRPRNQGLLTCWELKNLDIPHTLIVDNAGGLLMMQDKVDLVIVGADRISTQGYVCNKIGTYLKALAAFDQKIPFYVAAPISTIDPKFDHDVNFEIEARDQMEIKQIYGVSNDGKRTSIYFPDYETYNPAFDITPPHLISGIITEKGIFKPSELKGLL